MKSRYRSAVRGTDETLFAPLTEQLFHVRNIQDFPA